MGTYAFVTLDTHTKQRLHQLTSELNLPNAVRPDKYHVTLLYSKKSLPEYEPKGVYHSPIIAEPGEYAVFLQDDDNTRCLVLKLECPVLVNHHKYLMARHGGEYDFPDYIPHVTLSYDIGSLDIDTLPPISKYLTEILLVEEFGEPLSDNWVVDNHIINKPVDLAIASAI